MMAKDPHGNQELAVFKKFANAATLKIDLDTIEKRDPNEPDVICRLVGGEIVAFELVRLVPSEKAYRFALWDKTVKELYRHYEQLHDEERIKFDLNYISCLIHFEFDDQTPMSARRKVYTDSFSQLITLPLGFRGRVMQNRGSALSNIYIDDTGADHPIFDTNNGGFTSDPTKSTIQKKCTIEYKRKHPIELLAHFSERDILPIEIWIHQIQKMFRNEFSLGMFRRIWFFNETKSEVQYMFPEESND